MYIAFTYRHTGVALLIAVVAFFALTAQFAHAQVSDEELAVLQAQVDAASVQVQALSIQKGKVLGASSDDIFEKIKALQEQILSFGFKGTTSPGSGSLEVGSKKHTSTKDKKETLKQQITAYNKEIDRLTQLRDEAQKKLDALGDDTTTGTSTKTFKLKDVKSVVATVVDPIPNAIDDEYTLYKITLKSKRVVEVKACGYCTTEGRDALFKKAGYKGDISKLLLLADKGGVAVQMTLPDGGTYTYGDTLKVVWNQTGTVPKGSTACVILQDVSGTHSFAFPPEKGCVTVAGEEPEHTVSGKIINTAGYALLPGKYKVVLNIAGPATGGKDGANLASDSSDEYITVSNAELSTKAPSQNPFACSRTSSSKLENGKLACYGMWDYGGDFGGDVNMCGKYGMGDTTGCKIKAPVCSSGAAKATAYYSNEALKKMDTEIFTKNLGVIPKVLFKGIAGLWEYNCSN